MSEKSLVAFLEEWQTGFFWVVGTALVAVVSGVAVSSLTGVPAFFFLGFFGGAILCFLAFSYLFYGR